MFINVALFTYGTLFYHFKLKNTTIFFVGSGSIFLLLPKIQFIAMLSVSNLSVQFGKRILFDEVNTTFVQGNCYGIIGANGAGKSTFLKILSGVSEATSGHVHLEPGKRMSVLEQNHYAYDEYTVLETVIMGNKDLYKIKTEIDALYADYTDENAEKIGELQVQFEEMNGWNADSDAATMLSNLGIKEDLHHTSMADLDTKQRVRVLLSQCLFGNPDVLIMEDRKSVV